MIGPLSYWQWAMVAISLSICLSLILGPRLRRMTPPESHRDLCKRGCGIVHVLTCGHGIIIDGLPLHCERAYCHRGNHEAAFDGSGAVAFWPNHDDPEDAVEQSVHGGPPFAKMIL